MEKIACFFSGSTGTERIIDVCTHRLLSCHGSYMGTARHWLKAAHTHPESKNREIMLDSGAFSAWSKGEETTVDEVIASYDELVEAYLPFYKEIWLINLDKIPGERGRSATPDEIDEALRVSDRNFEILTKRYGDRVLPVFHQDESEARLREVMQQNPRYICVSPRNDLHEALRRDWATRAHRITGAQWTHGLAATGKLMMTEVPWRSVDSATWVQLAGYGALILCIGNHLYVDSISKDSSARFNLNDHTDNLPRAEQDIVRAAIEESGETYENCQVDHKARAWVNYFHFMKFVNTVERKVPPTQQGLFAL